MSSASRRPAPARAAASARRARPAALKGRMVLERNNYLLILVALVLIVVGYVVMAMESEIDGFLSLYVAPILLGLGYFGIIYAFLWQPRRSSTDDLSVPAQN